MNGAAANDDVARAVVVRRVRAVVQGCRVGAPVGEDARPVIHRCVRVVIHGEGRRAAGDVGDARRLPLEVLELVEDGDLALRLARDELGRLEPAPLVRRRHLLVGADVAEHVARDRAT